MEQITAAHVQLTFRYDPDAYLAFCRHFGEEPTQAGFAEFVAEAVTVDLDDMLPAGNNDRTVTVSPARRCRNCAALLHPDLDAWVDDTGGDVCTGNQVTGAGENAPHLAGAL